MEKAVLVKDIMTRKVLAVPSTMLISEASKLISDHNFDGIPVTDGENHLIGILTEYDLITKTSSMNMSFLQKILFDLRGERTDGSEYNESNSLLQMKVADVMNKEPLSLKEEATFNDVIQAFVTHHRVNPIPIVDNDNKLVGIISRFDVLRPLNLLGYQHEQNKDGQ